MANDEPNNNPVFRIGLRTKGCNGMAYTLEHAEIESKKKFEETVSAEKSKKHFSYFSGVRRRRDRYHRHESTNDPSRYRNGLLFK